MLRQNNVAAQLVDAAVLHTAPRKRPLQNVKTCNTIFGGKHIHYNTSAKRHEPRHVIDPPVGLTP